MPGSRKPHVLPLPVLATPCGVVHDASGPRASSMVRSFGLVQVDYTVQLRR